METLRELNPPKVMRRKLWLRKGLRSIVRLLFCLLTHIEVHGLENVPAHGAVILASNHLSRLDAPLLFILLAREDVTGLVADKYKKNPFFRPLIQAVNGIWINREEADFQALREARRYLAQGGMLGVAPEGTRSRDGVLNRAKNGIAYLAEKSGAPVLPVAIHGTEKAFHELARLRRPRLVVHFGELVQLPRVSAKERNPALVANTDEVMCRIAAMLPEEYRGYYANHARLKELSENQPSLS